MQNRTQIIYGNDWQGMLILPDTPDIVRTPLGHLVSLNSAREYLACVSEPVSTQIQFRSPYAKDPMARAHPVFGPKTSG